MRKKITKEFAELGKKVGKLFWLVLSLDSLIDHQVEQSTWWFLCVSIFLKKTEEKECRREY